MRAETEERADLALQVVCQSSSPASLGVKAVLGQTAGNQEEQQIVITPQ